MKPFYFAPYYQWSANFADARREWNTRVYVPQRLRRGLTWRP